MTKELVIFGTTDLAQVASAYFDADSPYEVVAFTVHQRYLEHDRLLERPIVAFERLPELFPPDRFDLFVAVGFKGVNQARAEIYAACKSLGYNLATYVSSKAMRWPSVPVGDNCLILEANVIQPFVRIGNDCIIWSGNHIGHHSSIQDHCFIASHVVISGNVTIGERCFLGVNATLRDGITIAPGSVIGAGANILRDVREPAVYAADATTASGIPFDKLKGF